MTLEAICAGIVRRVSNNIPNKARLYHSQDDDTDYTEGLCPACQWGLRASSLGCTRCGGTGITYTITLDEWVRVNTASPNFLAWCSLGTGYRPTLVVKDSATAMAEGAYNEAMAAIGDTRRVFRG